MIKSTTIVNYIDYVKDSAYAFLDKYYPESEVISIRDDSFDFLLNESVHTCFYDGNGFFVR